MVGMLTETFPITDLTRASRRLVERALARQVPIMITQLGREVAVLVPIERYREMDRRLVHRFESPRLVRPGGADPAHFELYVTVDQEAELISDG